MIFLPSPPRLASQTEKRSSSPRLRLEVSGGRRHGPPVLSRWLPVSVATASPPSDPQAGVEASAQPPFEE